MRTTITLDDGLATDLKRRARMEGKSVSAIIAEAVRAQLAKREGSTKTPPFRLVTVKGAGPRRGVDLRKLRRLEELEDIERFRPPRR